MLEKSGKISLNFFNNNVSNNIRKAPGIVKLIPALFAYKLDWFSQYVLGTVMQIQHPDSRLLEQFCYSRRDPSATSRRSTLTSSTLLENVTAARLQQLPLKS